MTEELGKWVTPSNTVCLSPWIFSNVTFFGPCSFSFFPSGCNFYSSSCGSLKNAFVSEFTLEKKNHQVCQSCPQGKLCWDCKICRLRGEWTYFKGTTQTNPLCLQEFSLAALPGTPFPRKEGRTCLCLQRAASVSPSQRRILPILLPLSLPWFWLAPGAEAKRRNFSRKQ